MKCGVEVAPQNATIKVLPGSVPSVAIGIRSDEEAGLQCGIKILVKVTIDTNSLSLKKGIVL